MAYEDMPCGVYAPPRPGTTIGPIIKPGALRTFLPSQSGPAFLLPAALIPGRTELRLYGVLRSSPTNAPSPRSGHQGSSLPTPRVFHSEAKIEAVTTVAMKGNETQIGTLPNRPP